MSKGFTAFLIGSDSLLIECCQLLKQSNHEVLGIITSTPRIQDWATENDIPFYEETDYIEQLKQQDFDYLFSITYLRILPDEVVATPNKATINFHDGPLPRYAGLNTPAWALINREQDYGISWHLVTTEVDKGDILLQRHFDIEADDTSLSLNMKCFEQAIDSFEELINGLDSDSLKPVAQDFSERTYFSKHKRPENLCVVDWSKTASEVTALVNGLNFGEYPNPLGSAKIQVGGTWYILVDCDLDSDGKSANPGEIIHISDHAITVSTGDGNVKIKKLAALSGESLALSTLSNNQEIAVGKSFLQLSVQQLSALNDESDALAKSEEFWLNQLRSVETIEPPFSESVHIKDAVPDVLKLELPVENSDGLVIPAFLALVYRLSRSLQFDIGYAVTPDAAIAGITSPIVPLRIEINPELSMNAHKEAIEQAISTTHEHGTHLLDLFARNSDISSIDCYPLQIEVGVESVPDLSSGTVLSLVGTTAGEYYFSFDSSRISRENIEKIRHHLSILLNSTHADSELPIARLDILNESDRDVLLNTFNETDITPIEPICVHHQFEQQVAKTPYDTAVVFRTDVINYINLNSRANQLAHYLISEGVTPDSVVGVFVDRSLDMIVCIMAVLKAGGAFVPMDPDFPAERLAYIFENSDSKILLTQEHLSKKAPVSSATSIICVDSNWSSIAGQSSENPGVEVTPENLAYVIYTSGSTGKPKGVMIEHRNVHNFFVGMDQCIPQQEHSAWLAVTSLSFDISILELFWTLNKGMKLILFKDEESSVSTVPDEIRNRKIDFDLFFWGSDGSTGDNKYKLMLEASRFADKNGFAAVFTPERHFNNWGGPYPNSVVTASAIASITENVHIRAGSCVVPLHHPIRIAEDWSVVDNISNGRVGISAASGWQPTDFVIRPEGFENNRELLFENIEIIQKLWRGESVEFEGVGGKTVNVATQPRPIQEQLPIWITSAGNVDTFKRAGSIGANLLTHLLGQSVEQVAEKIAAYRAALAEAGFDPASRIVTVMLHTLVGQDTSRVREIVREPLKNYLRGSINLLADNVWAFPTFKRPGDTSSSLEGIDIDSLEEEDIEAIVDFSFERYFNQSGLFGTPERCMGMVNRLKEIDVDEIGCLIDYGIDTEEVLKSLKLLAALKDQANADTSGESKEFGFAAQVAQHDITHFQCTPSMAQMLCMRSENKGALGSIKNLMIGGEALPVDLANDIKALHGGVLTNMYGPTETTIWSSTQVIEPRIPSIPIGKPIANTQMYILDDYLQPQPVGIPGDLYIGGEGVARGYQNREDLTTERFIPNPFKAGGKIYKTGDVAKYREDGVIEFLGRSDFQVKIRGFRIELGEIESCLAHHESVASAVVTVNDFAGDERLVAYVVSNSNSIDEELLRSHVRHLLPEYMVPSNFVLIDRIPQTPNGKIDRKALPSPDSVRSSSRPLVQPESNLESQLLEIWQSQLALGNLGVDEAFFDVGGNSLLLVAVHRELRKIVDKPVSLTDLYRFPTIRALANFLSGDNDDADFESVKQRAKSRRQRTQTRRRGSS